MNISAPNILNLTNQGLGRPKQKILGITMIMYVYEYIVFDIGADNSFIYQQLEDTSNMRSFLLQYFLKKVS